MATTTSEIQVTEAYIGLLGRAPDPAGLAYWAAQLDAAIAAGEDAAVALKKLTNDITLNDEWLVDGDGALDISGGTDAQNLANAETVVTNMYTRLFERTEVTQAELDYWAPKLVSGEFTSSEMAVALIQGAGTTDAAVLGFKQEAATYYVESVAQEDFNRTTAKSSVDSVDGPITLQASKDATDIIVSGVGVTKALSTASDTIAMTGGDDTVTGLLGTGATFAAGDSVSDGSTTDNDTLTITGDAGGTFGTVKNVENINVSLASRDLAGGFSLTTTNVTGGKITLTAAESVTIGGNPFAGEQTAEIANLSASDLSTVNIKDLTVTGASGTQSFTLDNDAATVSIAGVTANDTTVTLANNDVTLTISGTAATNDAMSITADNEVAIVNDASDVELLTLSGSNNDAVFSFTGVSDDASKMVFTAAGSNDITLSGAAGQFNGGTLVDNNSGTETLKLTGVAAASIEGFGVLSGGVTLASAGTHDLKLTSGNTLTNTTAGAAMSLDANDAATDSAVTINLNATANGITTDKFESVTIDANDSQATTTGNLDFGNDVTVVTISGTNDITTGSVTGAHSLTVTGDDVQVGAINATNEVALTGANDVTTTGAVSVANDVTLTAGTAKDQDVSIGGNVAITNGNFKAVGDDVKQTAGTTVVTKGDITVTATNDVNFANAVTASDGDILITSVAKDITMSAAVTATKGNVTINAACDANINNITAQNDIDINVATGAGGAGKDLADIDVLQSTGVGNITIDADDITDISGAITANNGNITVTSANDITDAASSMTASKGTITLTATAGDLGTQTGVAAGTETLSAANVVLTAADDITSKAAITAANDVTITTTGGDVTNDISQQGLITTTKAGTITLTGGAVTLKGGITAAESNVVMTAAGVATVDTAAISVTKGAVTITGNDATTTDVNIDQAVSASNDVIITGAGKVDIEATITSSKNNVTITGDQIDTKALTATVGSVTLTAIDPAKANTSLIEGDITAGTNVSITDGTWVMKNDVSAPTGIFAVTGDAGFNSDQTTKKVVAGQIELTTANDVTIAGTTDSVLIVGSGGGDYDLSVVEHAAASTDVTISLGGGNDTMELKDGADASTSKFIVATGGGVDTVTATSFLSGTTVDTGAGDDIISIIQGGGKAAGAASSSFDAGTGTGDRLILEAADYKDDKVSWSNIEELKVGDGTNQSITMSEAQFDGDNTFKILNTAGTLTVTGSTLDASQITLQAGSSYNFAFTGASTDDILVGGINADTLTGGTGQDTLTGGTGVDTFDIATAGDAGGGTTAAIKFDTITDFNVSGDSDKIDHAEDLIVATADQTAAVQGIASVTAGGKATFDALDDTLAEKLVAVAAAINNAADGTAGATVAGETVFFVHDGDTYVYISDGTAGYGTGDDLIKLTGHTGLATITAAGGDNTITIG